MSDDDKNPEKDMPAPFEEATEEEKQQFAEATFSALQGEGKVHFLPAIEGQIAADNPLTLEQDRRATALYHAVSAAERMRGVDAGKGAFQSGGKKEITTQQVIRLANYIILGDDL